jgi:mono/diheme cytochrome c family protein
MVRFERPIREERAMRLVVGCALLIGMLGVQAPAHASDAANGRELALRWCAACHTEAADIAVYIATQVGK